MARLAVALSGGVDSTCAAWLLKQAGHELLAFTLDLGPHSNATCLAAAKAAHELGLPHQVVDAREQFERQVVDYSLKAYRAGLTPNPCARCNAVIKIPLLLQAAQQAGCVGLATGHYARLVEKNGRIMLAEARDTGKSQTYFLARLQPRWLAELNFPLGEMSKEQVRELAVGLGLSAAAARESQDCCFLPQGGFARLGQANARPGVIKDSQGNELGRHQGLHQYTVGQRRGLGITSGQALYVLEIKPEEAVVVVGGQEELMQSRVKGYDYLAYAPADPDQPISVRLRYTRQGIACVKVTEGDGEVTADLAAAYRGVAPGQLMVFNQGEFIIGSAWIGKYANGQ